MAIVQISKIIKVEKLILIASAKNKFELPFIYRLFGRLNLIKLIPKKIFKKQVTEPLINSAKEHYGENLSRSSQKRLEKKIEIENSEKR